MSEKCKVKCDCHDDDDTKPVDGLGEATERPWTLYRDENGQGYIRGAGLNGECVISLDAGSGYAGKADAELIVKAVNSFDGLKQRVKELEAELEKWRGHLCGGVPEYRELGTTGMITDRRGDVWKKA